jgi:hypothetical protein
MASPESGIGFFLYTIQLEQFHDHSARTTLCEVGLFLMKSPVEGIFTVLQLS